MFGTGYLGATHAVGMAELGHEVLGVDVDAAKLEKLAAGEVPFYEPGLGEVLRRNIDRGRLKFTSSYEEAAEFADVFFLGVGTPQKKGEFAADMVYVDAVIETLAPLLTKPAVIFGKSTVPVGTAENVRARLQDVAPAGADVDLVWNPEFLREGAAISDFKRPDRVVVGTDKEEAREVMRQLYRPLFLNETPMLYTSRRTSELIKYAANAFLAVKITFINEMADLCEKVGANVQDVSRGIGLDNRIGKKFLHAGPGYGGSCFPKDTLALTKTGTGKLMYGAVNNYAGLTDIQQGFIEITNIGSFGLGAVNIATGAELTMNRSGELNFPNELSGGGIVRTIGNGTTTLTAANYGFTGRFYVDNGILQVGDGTLAGDTGDLGSANRVYVRNINGNTGQLHFNYSTNYTLYRPIWGNGDVVQQSPMVLTLGIDNAAEQSSAAFVYLPATISGLDGGKCRLKKPEI